jgi:hypothetical protein
MGSKLLLVAGCWLLVSCVTYNKCLDKFGTGTDSVRVEKLVFVHDTIRFTTPADSLSGWLSIIRGRLVKGGDTVSTSKKLKVEFLPLAPSREGDSTPIKIKYRVVRVPDTVVVVKRDTMRVFVDCPREMVDADKSASFFQKLWEQYKFFAAWALLVLLLIFLLRLTRRLQ